MNKCRIVREGYSPIYGVEEEYKPNYKYGIIKHRYLDANIGLEFMPEAIQMQNVPNGEGKGKNIKITRPMWEHIEKINTSAGYDYSRSIKMLLININYKKDTPYSTAMAESVTGGGNFFAYDSETKTHVRIVSLHADTTNFSRLDPNDYNWNKAPWLYWKMGMINAYGEIRKVGAAVDCVVPFIAPAGKYLWLPKNAVELFPDGHDYKFSGCDMWDGNEKILSVKNITDRTFHTDWFSFSTLGVVP